jgi:hypothetical protein
VPSRRSSTTRLSRYREGIAGTGCFLVVFLVGCGVLALIVAQNILDWTVLLIPAAFVVVGGLGAYESWSRRDKSPEQLAAKDRPFVEAPDDAAPIYPSIPDVGRTATPGGSGRYRLHPSPSPSRVFLLMLFGVLVWNCFFGCFAGGAVYSRLTGKPDWGWTVFVSPFVVIGLLAVLTLLRQIVLTAAYGPATAEITARSPTPGTSCRLRVEPNGLLRHHAYRVLVVCEEIARHAVSDDTFTDTRRVHEVEIPWHVGSSGCEGDFHIPDGAMHSFQAASNEMQWKIVVEARGPRWLNVTWQYPFIVRPASDSRSHP